jgi:hypothetical protein
MGIEQEWEQRIEEREQKIRRAFFEYARDNELPAFNTSHYFARQILSDESIVLKHCIITCLILSDNTQMVDEKWIIKE